VILFLENDVIFIGNDVSDWSISFKQGLHIKVQEVYKAVYEPHREKTEQKKDFTLKYKRYAKPCMSPTGTSRTKK
jgi:hypothetical protein